MRPWFVGYEAPQYRPLNAPLGERLEVNGDSFIRHGFVCGSTGSGKTVLAKAMVEEALLSGVPVIAIDLKGDLASMALHAGLQSPGSMRRVFGDDADERLSEYESGLALQAPVHSRRRAFADQVDVRLFTPRTPLARRLAMSAFPSTGDGQHDAVEAADRRALNQSLVRGLAVRMWGNNAVKRKLAEISLLEELVGWAQEHGRSLEGLEGLKELGRLVYAPPIFEIGGMAIDEYLDEKARSNLRRHLAAQCAGANQDWFRGEPLRVDNLVAPNPDGRTPLAVIYMGHIVEFEDKSLAIAKVCAEIYRWMRAQGGSSKLKFLLYIDEVGGASGPTSYFPSHPYQPASKGPLGLLIRQARAYGVGVLLATQNPMSVDVQALNNIGTWAVGRLNQDNEIKRLSAPMAELGLQEKRLRERLSQIPTHTFLTAGEALLRPTLVDERWLSSIHTVLTPRQVQEVHGLLGSIAPAPPDGQSASSPRATSPPTPVPDPSAAVPSPSTVTVGTRPSEGHLPETQVTRPNDDLLVGAWWLEKTGVKERLPEGRTVTVGRSSKCDITLKADEFMSGRHAELTAEGDTLSLRSLKSHNPALADEEAVLGSKELHAGDGPVLVRMGRTEVTVVWRAD